MARDAIKISKNLDDNSITNRIDVNISDGVESLLINADGSINSVVSATDLDIRDLSHVSDSVQVGDGTEIMLVNADGSINAVVTATDLDIRNLSASQDNVAISDGTDTLAVNADGSINVTLVGTSFPSKTDDSAFTIATDAVSPIGALADETAPDSVDEGDVGLVRMTLDRKLLTRVVGATDANRMDVDASGHAQVDIAASSVTLTVQATDLDIRDLSAAQDNVAISDGTDTLAINADGSINAVVTATDLDIRNLSAAQDNVAISDGTDTLGVNADGSINAVVTATDLDIRDLSHATDSVKVGDGTDFLAVNTDGSINVVTQPSSGTPVNDFDQAAALASAASDNHDYTASGGTFEVHEVSVSGESLGTFQILLNGVVKGYLRTSVEHPNDHFKFPDGTTVADTQVVRVVRTNDSNKAYNFESTIKGYQN